MATALVHVGMNKLCERMNVFHAKDNMSGWVDTWACVWVTLKKTQMDSRNRRYNFYLLPTHLPPGRKKHEDQKATKTDMIFRKNSVIWSILLSVLDYSLQRAPKKNYIGIIIPITALGLPTSLPCYIRSLPKQLPWQVISPKVTHM